MSSIGMFGPGGRWGIPIAPPTLMITVGGITTKPRYIDGSLQPRKLLEMTISVDHDPLMALLPPASLAGLLILWKARMASDRRQPPIVPTPTEASETLGVLAGRTLAVDLGDGIGWNYRAGNSLLPATVAYQEAEFLGVRESVSKSTRTSPQRWL